MKPFKPPTKSQLQGELCLVKEDFLVGEGLKLGSPLRKEGAQKDSYGGPEANRSGAGFPATRAKGSLRRSCFFASKLAFH